MKVLHIAYSDSDGGAAIATVRLHRAMRRAGIDSRLHVVIKCLDDQSIQGSSSPITKFASLLKNGLIRRLLKLMGPVSSGLMSLNLLPSGLLKIINNSDADIVHLHWVNGETISISDIAKIRKPIAWTLHDMWPFVGLLHYDCATSAELGQQASKAHWRKLLNLDSLMRQIKRKHWKNLKVNFIAPSDWMAEEWSSSAMFPNSTVRVIANTLDTGIFRPISKQLARDILGLPSHAKIILFGAMSSLSDPRKGYQFFREALSRLVSSNLAANVHLAIMGGIVKDGELFELPVTSLGTLHDEVSISLAFQAADVFVAPSLQDNLPNTVLESISSGTPVVAFEIGGMPNLIDHKKNGYLAKPFDVSDLVNGISWVIDNQNRHEFLSKNARAKALNEFSNEKIVERHLSYYRECFKS